MTEKTQSNSPAPHPQSSEVKVAATRVSLYSNLFLTALKITVGILSGSVSVLSEGAHSASDLLASWIAYFSVRMADLPPDEHHPYGHGKAESLSTLAEAIILLCAALYIIYEAARRLVSGAGPQRVDWGVGVMAVSAVINVLVVRFMLKAATETDSLAVQADAENHRVDIYTAVGVLLGLVLVRLTGLGFFDPLCAIGVSLMIIRAACQLTLGALAPLMDTNLPAEELAIVRRLIDSAPGVLSYHKLRTRKSGSARHVDAHVLMEDNLSLAQAHDLTERLEDRIRDELPNVYVTIHTEPYRAELRHQQEAHGSGAEPVSGEEDHTSEGSISQ